MRSFKVLSCVAAMALVALVAAPIAEAQCVPAKNLASAQIGTAKALYGQVAVDDASVTPIGDEIGRFWQSNDSTLGNNFAGGCPASSFWKTVTAGAAAPVTGEPAIQGAVGAAGCSANTCPASDQDLTVLIEDWAAGFPPPGVGGDAAFVLWRVNPTPTLLRTWDFARTAATLTVFPFTNFPRALVQSSGRNGMNIEVTMNYADVAPNFHGSSGGAVTPGAVGSPLPPAGSILKYDLLVATGLADPGRDRTLWTQVASVDYPGAGVPGVFHSVACPDTVNNAFIAVGMTFDGGTGPDVASRLVGKATALECDPNLANPDAVRPTKTKETSGRREAGRR